MTANEKRTRHAKYLVAAAVSVITFLVYLQALRNDFVNWDDNEYVYENPAIHALSGKFFLWAFFSFHEANWHPLSWISHALDYALWGLNPIGHHLTNNSLHAVNTFVVVLLVVRLIELTNPGSPVPSPQPRFTLIAAATTGLLFGIHPLHVESVAWVSERKDLLCAFFSLLALLFYLRYAKATEEHISASRKHYILTMTFFIFALLSKPMAVTFPLVILILDWYPLRRIRSSKTLRSVFPEKLLFFILSLGAAVAALAAQSSAKAVMSQATSFPTRVLVAGRAVVSYLLKIIFPLDLSPFYPYPRDVSVFAFRYFVPVVIIAGITVSTVWVSRRNRLWLAVWAYFLITLLPVLGVIQVGLQSMADRYTYLPSLGPFLLLGLGAARVWEGMERKEKSWAVRLSVILPCTLLLFAMSFLTVRQITVWKDSFTLWDTVIEREPGNVFFAYMNRAIAYDEKGRYDLAVSDFDRAAAINPSDEKIYSNRAITYSKVGYFDKAIEDCNRALSINPDSAEAYNNRGIAYSMKGLLDEAIEDYTRALARDPQYLKAFINRGNTLLRKGFPESAVDDYTRALAINHEYANAYTDRGFAYLRMGNAGLAVSDLRRGCGLGSDSACAALKNLTNN